MKEKIKIEEFKELSDIVLDVTFDADSFELAVLEIEPIEEECSMPYNDYATLVFWIENKGIEYKELCYEIKRELWRMGY